MYKLLLSLIASVLVAPAFAQSTTSTGATTTTLEEVAPSALEKITVSLTAESYVSAAEANRGAYEGSESFQYLGIAYDLGNARKVQVRQYFTYNATDKDQNDEYAISETMLRYVNGKALILGDAALATDLRLYVPMSEYVRDVGQWQLRMENEIEQAFGKFAVVYGLGTRAFFYSDNSDGQESFRMQPGITLAYQVNKSIKPFVYGYTEHKWIRNGTGRALYGSAAGELGNRSSNSDKFKTDIGAAFNIGKNVSLLGYVTTEDNLRTGTDNYNPFEEEANTYEIDLTISL